MLYNPDVPGSTGWYENQIIIGSGLQAPDGSMSAYSLTASSGANDSYILASAPTQNLTDNETMTGSIWLRSNTQRYINLYLTENSGTGYDNPASKSVLAGPTWQQYSLSGIYHYGQQLVTLQVGGGGTFTSGEVDIWGARLEDKGQMGRTVTNFAPFSQRMTTGPWTSHNVTTSDNAGTAPDGTPTAATATASAGTSVDGYIVTSISNPWPTSGPYVTGSIWIRVLAGSSTINVYLSSVQNNSNVTLSSQQVSLTSTWQRVQLTGADSSSISTLFLQIGGAQSFVNGAQIQIWGAQLELSPSAGPYVATGSAAASVGTNLTNLLPNSSQLTSPVWGYSAASGQVNAAAAPDGTTRD